MRIKPVCPIVPIRRELPKRRLPIIVKKSKKKLDVDVIV